MEPETIGAVLVHDAIVGRRVVGSEVVRCLVLNHVVKDAIGDPIRITKQHFATDVPCDVSSLPDAAG